MTYGYDKLPLNCLGVEMSPLEGMFGQSTLGQFAKFFWVVGEAGSTDRRMEE